MKRVLIILGMIVLCGAAQAQYFRYVNVPAWQGPKRAWIGGGLVQRVGVPDFGSWGSDKAIHPDAFGSPMNMNLALGLDLESGEVGLTTGPFFHFDFSKDGWTADFSTERPGNLSAPVNENFIFRYDMTCMHLSGTFGWGLYYHFSDRLEVGLGTGLYLLGSLGTKYGATCIRKSNNEVVENFQDDPWEFGGPTSNPMNIGIEGKFDVMFFYTEDMYVGLQARYDAYPFYCSLDDVKNFVGQELICSDNNRPRMVAMLTLGARW